MAGSIDTLRRDRVVGNIAVPVLIRGAEMILQLLVLAWLNGSGPSLTDRLLKWDGQYYRQIASSGYSSHVTVSPNGTLLTGSDVAFHPLFPALAALVRAVTRMPVDSAVLLVAALSSLAASVAVNLLARHVLDSARAGYIACALLGALPMAITLQMGYAESLYIALAAAGLLCALRGQWWWAAGFVFAAGLTRPTGLALAVVIPLAAIWLHRRQVRAIDRSVVVWATIAGALGVPVYWLFLWIWTGRFDAWFVVEKNGWDSHFDFGLQTARFLRDTLGHPDGLVGPVVVAVIVGYLLAGLVTVAGRWPLPVTGYLVLSILLALTSTNYWHSKPRLLLTAFVVVLPAAAALNRFRTSTVVVLVAAGTFASAWFGAYMLTIWPYAI